MITLLLTLLITSPSNAQVMLKSRTERVPKRIEQTVVLKKSAVQKEIVSRHSQIEPISNNKNSEMDLLIAQAEKRPNISDFSFTFNINTGTVIKGRLLNSILSTNLLSPVVIEITEGTLIPIGSRLICQGSTKYKRVHTYCRTLVLPEDGAEEFDVNVIVLNKDGSAGLKADEVYSNDGKYIVGQVAIEALKAAAIWDQSMARTAIGDRPIADDKNRLIGGLNGGLDAVGDVAQRELKTEEPKVVVYAGKEVLVYFEKRFKK